MSEIILILSVAVNYLPPKMYSGIFKFSIIVYMLDFFLCVIWLPIGVSKTYGFRSAKDVFTMTCMFKLNNDAHFRVLRHYFIPDNGTGAPAGWNWLLGLSVSRTTSFNDALNLGQVFFLALQWLGLMLPVILPKKPKKQGASQHLELNSPDNQRQLVSLRGEES